MGEPDLYGKEYFNDEERFVDLFNGILYHGKNVIQATELEDASAEVVNLLNDKAEQRLADKAKWWRGQLLVLLLLENQDYIDYHMVLRSMQMEAAQYMLQWRKLKREHRKKKDLSGDEFLSGMKKQEKFHPVILLTVYYNPEKAWDGARTLHELIELDGHEEALGTFVNDYKINLFDFHDYNDFSDFPEPLRSFFGFLRCCTEKEAMKKYLEQNKAVFEHFDEATAKFLSSLTNIRGIEKYRKKEEGKVTYNMCKAFEDMRLEGLEQGREQGREQEREQGIRSLMENMELSLKQAMDALSIPVDEQSMYAAKIHEQ